MRAPVSGDDLEAILVEIRSTKETAQGIAHDGPAPGADVPRVLAGLLSHLAEQLERMASLLSKGSDAAPVANADAQEEDISPQDAPAEPARDLHAGDKS
jgi:hypothetical protein